MPPWTLKSSSVIGWCGLVALAEAEVRVHRQRVDDLAGIEQPVRVERGLDLAEGLDDARAVHLLEPDGADDAVAVLAVHRAAELEHQRADAVGDAPHALDVVALLEVEHGPDVQATDAGVGVMPDAVDALFGQETIEPADVVRQAAPGRPPGPR